jgi:multidrug efflux pump subunit AcrA (membrane-fusion protein)
MGGADEKPGSTRIIWIIPEGTPVKAGQVVCELDSSAFKDELQAQRIKWSQAKAVVDQAEAIYRVNDITFREYRDGIYPQDIQLIRQYIIQCETAAERARKTEAWSREVMEKRFRAPAQYQADKLGLDQAELALREARGMEVRLIKYTGPKLLKSLEAKLKSIESDKLAQRASFEIEDDRLRRLERMVANCTIRAPADGILVYNNQSNGWSGQVETQIQEGVTVREGQTLFDLPDPKRMRVKVKVNESKMASVRPGQRAKVRVEAFPGRPLTGVVSEITPIPAVQNRFSDVKIYFANVEIDASDVEGLRPGMSAEVSFLVDEAPDSVTRLPLQAVRWVDGRSFVAVGARVNGETRWDWRPVTLGRIAPGIAEVVRGLNPGEHVVATPDELPAPDPARFPPPVRTAAAPGGTSHGG